MLRSVFAAALAVLVIGAIAPSPACASTSEIDRVLVIVNDEVITESEFRERYRGVLRDLASRGGEPPPRDLLRRQVLERMINDRIQLQVAKRLGITVSDEMVEEALRNVARGNRMSVEELQTKVASEGLTFDSLREHFRQQLTIRSLLEREIQARVDVTDEELEAFLASQASQTPGAEYNVSHILIRLPKSATGEEIEAARARAEEVLQELRDGLDFRKAILSYSQANDALEGGNLGWRKPGQLPALFLDALEPLKPGEFTDILRSPNGFHILHLNDVRGASGAVVSETHARHILIKTDAFISVQEAVRRLQEIRNRIENGEDFAELARAHSDDTVSSVNGGDLGWVQPGETIRPFESTMDDLQVGELSQPVRTPYGVHLIQVLDRRKTKVGEEFDRNKARQELRARKAEERYEQWLRQLRDESYVKLVPHESSTVQNQQ